MNRELVLTWQHDHPVVTVPADVERNLLEGEVRIGNRLASVLLAIAVFIDHDRCPALHQHLDQHEPVIGADFIQVAGNGIHDPPALRSLTQVSGAIGQQVPTSNAVVLLGAGKLRHAAVI